MGQLITNTRRSDGVPDPDGTLKETVRIKIRHYHNVYLNRPDPIEISIRFLFLSENCEKTTR